MRTVEEIASHIKQTANLYAKNARVMFRTNDNGSYSITVEIPKEKEPEGSKEWKEV